MFAKLIKTTKWIKNKADDSRNGPYCFGKSVEASSPSPPPSSPTPVKTTINSGSGKYRGYIFTNCFICLGLKCMIPTFEKKTPKATEPTFRSKLIV